MKNGLYSVRFSLGANAGYGVINVQDGKLTGGDSAIYYTGTVAKSDENFTAIVTTGRHADDRSMQSVFGIDNVEIKLTGRARGNAYVFKGNSPQAPSLEFDATLRLLA